MDTDLIHNSYLLENNPIKKAIKKYYEKNKESILIWNKEYYKTEGFLEKREEYAKTYYEKHKEIVKQKRREKYAREKELKNSI